MEGVLGYDKDQLALVVPDSITLGSQVPVTLDTLTLNQIINMIKESKIDELSAYLNGLRISCHQPAHFIKSEVAAIQTVDPTSLNDAVKTTTKKEEIGAFSSKIIHSQTKNMLLENSMHVMMQSLKGGGDGPHLPHSLRVMNTYTKVTTRNK